MQQSHRPMVYLCKTPTFHIDYLWLAPPLSPGHLADETRSSATDKIQEMDSANRSACMIALLLCLGFLSLKYLAALDGYV